MNGIALTMAVGEPHGAAMSSRVSCAAWPIGTIA